MTEVNANQYRDMYATVGVDLDTLGCVMLDTAVPALRDLFDADPHLAADMRAAAHVTDNPNRFWIKGLVGASETSHVTLLYGLLPGATRANVDRVLDGWTPPEHLYVDSVGDFPSPYKDEPYHCIVAHVGIDDGHDRGGSLRDAHARLSMLPHIDTFPDYRPHVTLGYINAGNDEVADIIDRLTHALADSSIATGPLNYGRSIK